MLTQSSKSVLNKYTALKKVWDATEAKNLTVVLRSWELKSNAEFSVFLGVSLGF